MLHEGVRPRAVGLGGSPCMCGLVHSCRGQKGNSL